MIDPLSFGISAGTAHPYHEAFWVVVGTAAPVITLAAIVASGQLHLPETHYVERVVVRTTVVASGILGLCCGTQIVALGEALNSLAHERDTTSLVGPATVIIVGLLLLLATTLWSAFTPIIVGGTRSRKAEQNELDAASADTDTLPKPPDQRLDE
jgi:hypothetical protein